MTLLLLLLPLLFSTSVSLGAQRNRFRGLVLLGLVQFIIAAYLYTFGRDPMPILSPLFDLTPLNLPFLLAYAGLQLVAFLSLPRGQRTQSQLYGALLFSLTSIATITAVSDTSFLVSFIVSLFVPLMLGFLEAEASRSSRVFLVIGVICASLTILGVNYLEQRSALGLGLPILFAASVRMGFVPFHLWVRRMVLAFPLQWSVLFFLSYPSIALFLRARLGAMDSPVQEAFLQLACVTAVYGAWLAVVQREIRHAYYYLLLSFLGSIGIGLALASTTQALSGVLLFWFAGSLALAGFGFTIEILESRLGKITLGGVRGLIRRAQALGAVFLILGLASVGFPGLCAFLGQEIMLSGIFQHSAWAVLPILLAFSLNGITVLRWFFAVFFGPSEDFQESIDLLRRERVAFFILLAIIVGTGLFPRPLFELGRQASGGFSATEFLVRPEKRDNATELQETGR